MGNSLGHVGAARQIGRSSAERSIKSQQHDPPPAEQNGRTNEQSCPAGDVHAAIRQHHQRRFSGRVASAAHRSLARLRRRLGAHRDADEPTYDGETDSSINGLEEQQQQQNSLGKSEHVVMRTCDQPKENSSTAAPAKDLLAPCLTRQSLQPVYLSPEQAISCSNSSLEPSQEAVQRIIYCFPFPNPKSPGRGRKSANKQPAAAQQPSERAQNQVSAELTNVTAKMMLVKRARSAINNNDCAKGKEAVAKRASAPVASGGGAMSSLYALHKMVESSVDTIAVTALPLDCWLKERLKHWVQLSGHEGSIVPATECTLWKKRAGTDFSEAQAYQKLMKDSLRPYVPHFVKDVVYRDESFIEIEDLTATFESPSIMDVKMGIRTFLESEVRNPVKRGDLYKKMLKLDPSEPTEEDHVEKAITKLRYMQFRERESSTATLGFRIEAMKVSNGKCRKCFQKVKTREQVRDALREFLLSKKSSKVADQFLKRLKAIRAAVEQSDFFADHEVIGSSLLFVYDSKSAGVWLIDFAKALPLESNEPRLDHRSDWTLGNREDGYFTGLDNLIQIFEHLK